MADLEEEKELLKVSVDERLEDGERIQSLINQNNSLMAELSGLKIEFSKVKGDAEKENARNALELNKQSEALK